MIWFMIAGSEIRGIHLRAREKCIVMSLKLSIIFLLIKARLKYFLILKLYQSPFIIEFWVLYRVSCIGRQIIYHCTTWETLISTDPSLSSQIILSASWNFLLNCSHEFYICFIFQVQRFFFVCLNEISSSLFPSLFNETLFLYFPFSGKK